MRSVDSSGVTQSCFARCCCVTRAAIHKAKNAGSVVVGHGGLIDPSDPANHLYLVEHRAQEATRQVESGEVSRGWAALCYLDGDRSIPFALLPPYTLRDDEILPVRDFDSVDLGAGTVIVDGAERAVELVIDGSSPPPWLEEEAAGTESR